jgi:large subunit ribosomal protein L22
MKAILRHLRITPAKANLTAYLVRGKKVQDAIDILKFTPKKTARPLMKLIASAMANGVNNFKQDKNDLYVKEIIVTTGPTLKRSVPVSRGRANPILKRTCHITVKLDVLTAGKDSAKTEKAEKPAKTETTKVKSEPKTTVKKTSTKK